MYVSASRAVSVGEQVRRSSPVKSPLTYAKHLDLRVRVLRFRLFLRGFTWIVWVGGAGEWTSRL